jgi:hypothetical protein
MSVVNIIELSSYDKNAKLIKSTDFEITSSNKVILNQGDVVSIKNVFLDTRNFSTGALVFGEDVDIEIDFITYYMNSFNNQNTLYNNSGDEQSEMLSAFWDDETGEFDENFSNEADVDGMPYVLMCCPITKKQDGTIDYSITANIGDYVPYVKTFKYTLGAGTYTPELIASTLTNAFQRFQKNWLLYEGRKVLPTKYDFFVEPPTESQGVNETNAIGFNPQLNANACFVNPVGFWDFVSGEGNAQGNADFYRISNLQQDLDPVSPLIPANKHGLGYVLANMISDGWIRNDNYEDTTQQLILFQSQRLIGTTQLTLSYNLGGNGLFCFDNMHQPLAVMNNGVFTPAVALVNLANHDNGANEAPFNANVPQNTPKVNDLYIIDQTGGICFTDLRSSLEGFWEDYLGFGDVKRLCVNPDLFRWSATGAFGISYNTFLQKTTRPYMGTNNILYQEYLFTNKPAINDVEYQMLINPNYQVFTPYDEAWDLYDVEAVANIFILSNEITEALNGINPPQNALDCGHYLISIEGSYNTQLNNSQDTYQIKAICSKYYLNNDFVSGGFETSINYEHLGLPVILSKFNVKILNPSNKQPADLGKNNVIYLQIVKKPEQVLNIQNVGSPNTDESERQEAQVQSSSAK